MAQNIEKNKLSLSNLTLTSDSFSRRRTMMMMEEICPNPPSPTRQQQQQQQQQRSRLPTPSVPSRRQSLVNASVPRYGSISISTSSNTTTDTQIPHPHPPRPRPSHHGSFTEGAGQSECLNQDGRYPLVPTRPRKRISEVNQQQHTAEWGLVNNNNSNSARPLPRSHTMGNMTSGNSSSIRRFMGSTSSSAARVGYRDRGGSRGNHLVTTTTMPGDRHRGLSGHEEGKGVAPEKKDDRPTIRQVSSVDVGASTVYSSALTEGIAGNVNTHSPPVTRYRVIRGLPEEFSAATAGVAVSTTPSPNHGDYSFAASDDTIGLALTASVPPSGDSSYESARETSELVNFSRPKRFSFASETQIPLLANHGTENQKTKIEDRTLSEMNDENSDNPMVCFHLPILFPFHIRLTNTPPFLTHIDHNRPINLVLAWLSDGPLGPISHRSARAALAYHIVYAKRG